jgi:hypothetical protein
MGFDAPARGLRLTKPRLLQDSSELMGVLSALSQDELAALMKLSPALAELGIERNAAWVCHPKQDSGPALFSFRGAVFASMGPRGFDDATLQYAQEHLRLLSGLYGLLRPFDKIMGHRLEMGTRLKTQRGANLYAFWGELICRLLEKDLKAEGSGLVLNLASAEYFKATQPKLLAGRVLTPQFKERKGDGYRMLGIFAKQARGHFTRWVLENRITEASDLHAFAINGYAYSAELSDGDNLVFTRG